MPNQAQLGYVGFVSLDGSRVRATSCDIRATQAIDSPNLVDGKFDKTTYQVQAKEVGGSISFPAVHEDGDSVTRTLWNGVIERNTSGRLANRIDNIKVKYATGVSYEYSSNIVDTFEYSVTQSDMVNINIGIIGIDRDNGATGDATESQAFYEQRNSRVVTWNDAVVKFLVGSGAVGGDEIRSFSINVNNNSQRYYTLNGKLVAQDVAATKRDITGSITVMGRNELLAARAGFKGQDNQTRCTETSEVIWGYCVGSKSNLSAGSTAAPTCAGDIGVGCAGNFIVRMGGTVFQIEEIAITNELLETTVNYRVLPGSPIVASGISEGYTNQRSYNFLT
jgi:hypothetical protein